VARAVSIDRERRLSLSGVVLLSDMLEGEHDYPLVLEGAQVDLEPVLEWLHNRGYVEIVDDERYVVADKGHKVFDRFTARYRDFVSTMDVYSAVDLEEGVFAYERFFDFDSDADFESYLSDTRWDDLRVAVAELKRIDPVEIVFMSFLREERVTPEGSVPGDTLLDGAHWQEIEAIVNSALCLDDLAFEDTDGRVEGRDVLERIIVEGAELNIELKKHEAELDAEDERSGTGGSSDRRSGAGGPDGEVVEEYTVEQYTPYLDPLYVSPVWMGLWLL
jgi:hypothetical protein